MAFVTPYKECFKVGDRIILELSCGDIFEGLYADGGKDLICLADVLQHNNNNNALGGFYEFYREEIANIHRLEGPASKQAKENIADSSEVECKVIKVSEKEYFRLKEMFRTYIYVDNPDKRYFDAIEVLLDSETVGVVCLGTEKRRFGGCLQLLVLATWKQIYIFDLSRLEKKELYPELKDIFESKHVCKVIHKSSGLVDKLYREYKVYVRNTFDTQIVDLMLQKKESGTCLPFERNLSECLTHYLNLPSSILEKALNIPGKSWCERPLSDKMKEYAAQLVAYLILLKEHLQKLLLKDVYDTIERVQDHVYDMDDFNFSNFNSQREVPKDIQELIPDLGRMHVSQDSTKAKIVEKNSLI